ncbi:MAG: hypothetical protein JXD19_04545 [Deltaproteobacteria bacterium]|nr:hypothetical protein [Deltaproteobacteria bacterium]
MKTSWKCNQCGYTAQSESPPEKCPSCRMDCTFVDITCYTPECGGPESGNIDPQVAKDPKREPK